MAQIDLRTRSLLATTGVYVDALHEGEADWRDYYEVSSALIFRPEAEAEPDGE